MIATARVDLANPLIHGLDARRDVDTGTVTRRWARATLAEVRRVIAEGMAARVRLLAAEAAHVAALPDESDRECRCMGQRELFEGPVAAVAPAPPPGPSPLRGPRTRRRSRPSWCRGCGRAARRRRASSPR